MNTAILIPSFIFLEYLFILLSSVKHKQKKYQTPTHNPQIKEQNNKDG